MKKHLRSIEECTPGTTLYDAVAAYQENDKDEAQAVERRQAAVAALQEAERKAYDSTTPATDRAALKMLLTELTADMNREQSFVESCQRERMRLDERITIVLQEAADMGRSLAIAEQQLLPGGYFDIQIEDAKRLLVNYEEDKRSAIERIPKIKEVIAKMVGNVRIEDYAAR